MAAVVFIIVLSGSCLYAAICGGAPERLVAGMLLTAAAATAVAGYGFPQPEGNIRWPVMLVDVALAASLIWVALTADRLWPLLAAALQLITAVAHPALDLAETPVPLAYLIVIFMSGYLIPPVLAFGTFLHQRRMARTLL